MATKRQPVEGGRLDPSLVGCRRVREAEAEAAMGDLAAALMRGGSMLQHAGAGVVLAARGVVRSTRSRDLMELDASVLEAASKYKTVSAV